MLTRNNLIYGTMALGAMLLCLVAGALYDPLNLKSGWKDALSVKPAINDEQSLYNNAYGYFSSNDDLLARDVTNRLLKVSPQSSRGHKLMAALHMKNEDFIGALKESRIAAQLDPSDPMAQMAVAQSLVGVGDKQGAVKVFQQLSRNPLSPQPVKEKANDGIQKLLQDIQGQTGSDKQKMPAKEKD